ncbi:MAG: sodium-dependent bicarbonate transport family permease [Betaproteobacteria bacterium]|nr:sodium-dependent bicarbonate transport family permease [Betaproteobacteria bacterium]
MDVLLEFFHTFLTQFQTPTLAFLLGGMLAAALGGKLDIPDAIYRFCVFMLLMRIGIQGGMEIREGDIGAMLLPALFSAVIGMTIVVLGWLTLARLRGVRMDDALATAGLFGAVSASTMAAGMFMLEDEGIFFEAWVPALYPFMDIPALVLAIVLANLYLSKKNGGSGQRVAIWPIVKESLQGPALSAMLLGLAIGLFTRPEVVFEGFYDLLFRGLLTVLMITMGIEAYQRLNELRKVAHWYIAYAFVMPIVHGLIGFGLGYIAHLLAGFSPGGVILLAIIAASSSDISGPPTLRAGIPTANPSSYIGSSTGVGTPVAIAICIPLFLILGQAVFDL